MTRYYKRGFLNTNEGLAAFETSIDKWNPDGQGFDATFDIPDCNRKVSLDFGVYDSVDIPLKLEKLNLLISELQAFREELLKVAEESLKCALNKSKPDEEV